MDLNKLSLKERIGQKFIFGVNSYNVDILVNLIKNYSIGGVILYKKNYNNYDEMLSVIKKLKTANKENKIPLFIAIDQEGGRVNRMPSEFKNLKNIYDVSKKNDVLVSKYADITGKMLSRTGINMNFAPVMDISLEDNSSALSKRCFYGDVNKVSEMGIRYIKGLENNGIISVIKHFPGHGVSKMDSHFITPYVYNFNGVLNKHIIPFDNVIKSGIDAIMVGHLVIRRLTDGAPASISAKFIDEYLRKRNNFDGLVITDEINMLSRNIIYKFGYLKKAFLSGSDIVLMKIKKENEGIDAILKYIKLVSNDMEYEKIINDSVKRIVRIKDKYKISDDTDRDRDSVDDINTEIEKLNKMCSD